MAQITNPVSPSEFEHYYSVVVLKLAYLLSKKTAAEFSLMSHRSRNHWLNKASVMASELFGDEGVVDCLPLLSKNLTARK